ncbi:hypothetical protein C7293_19865 [filamentous cyanobacterium CCT1]|nr:hypothetical protein C7293_19865 [filamentous cyanobacterium CCT1]PSN76202.1 hypothetical protein C8B47_28530 [filamentous cyanobacterium CCP4]
MPRHAAPWHEHKQRLVSNTILSAYGTQFTQLQIRYNQRRMRFRMLDLRAIQYLQSELWLFFIQGKIYKFNISLPSQGGYHPCFA